MSDPLVIVTILFLAFGKFVLAGLWMMALKFTTLVGEKWVFRLPYDHDQMRAELMASWVIPIDGIVFGLALYFDLVKLTKPTLGASMMAFLVMFIWFEVWFYGTHRLMHTRMLYAVHALHHRSRVTCPLTGLRFSLPEKMILTLGSVGFALIASWLMPITLPAILAFFAAYYVESIAGHSNVEIVPTEIVQSPIGKVFASTTFHALHHARVRGHYGLTTTVLDHLFGTVFPDYVEVHERVVRGESLRHLGERA